MGAMAPAAASLSGTALALVVIAALVLLACAAWALARLFSRQPRWTLALRHSLAEAAHRASSTCAELGDWIKLGH